MTSVQFRFITRKLQKMSVFGEFWSKWPRNTHLWCILTLVAFSHKVLLSIYQCTSFFQIQSFCSEPGVFRFGVQKTHILGHFWLEIPNISVKQTFSGSATCFFEMHSPELGWKNMLPTFITKCKLASLFLWLHPVYTNFNTSFLYPEMSRPGSGTVHASPNVAASHVLGNYLT